MEKSSFVRADDVAKDLDISVACAYKLIRKLNDELKAEGFVTIQGRLSRKYYELRVYGIGAKEVG